MDPNAPDLSHTPRSLRALAGLTQVELAERVSLSVPTIKSIEDGGEGVEVESLRKAAAGLGVSVTTLLAACERERARRAASGSAA